ncbi:L(+)-tartrate dehydratase subunit alpha [Jeotgalibaca sp. A122]|uniref:L(+)-tartrate dehydratase subunit alpha n=1 Tax=Jeotgalibaca sp. A122 TaxID=3457322 RepID=UPI003FCF0076
MQKVYEPTQMSQQAAELRDILSKFIGVISRRLPDDVAKKLNELSKEEVDPLQQLIYQTMMENQMLAEDLKRPSCQDTGVIQFFLKVGENFPLIGDLKEILKESVVKSTIETPLRHNAVETFDEYNTGLNIGTGVPTILMEIEKDSDQLDMYVYMAGGGCTLPGAAKVLMPGEGYEGVVRFVMDQMTSYGINACPPLLVGIGIGTSVETAALNSKLALMRDVDSVSPNENASKMERLLEDGINSIGLGPQGFGGKKSVMGVNIINTARHPSTIGVAINTGCWSHRRGHIILDSNLNYEILTHEGVEL